MLIAIILRGRKYRSELQFGHSLRNQVHIQYPAEHYLFLLTLCLREKGRITLLLGSGLCRFQLRQHPRVPLPSRRDSLPI